MDQPQTRYAGMRLGMHIAVAVLLQAPAYASATPARAGAYDCRLPPAYSLFGSFRKGQLLCLACCSWRHRKSEHRHERPRKQCNQQMGRSYWVSKPSTEIFHAQLRARCVPRPFLALRSASGQVAAAAEESPSSFFDLGQLNSPASLPNVARETDHPGGPAAMRKANETTGDLAFSVKLPWRRTTNTRRRKFS